MWRNGNPGTLLVEVQTGAATVESSMELPQKINNGIVLQPSNSTSGNISEEPVNTVLKEDMQVSVFHHLFALCPPPPSPAPPSSNYHTVFLSFSLSFFLFLFNASTPHLALHP